jgi:hypothetical protein
LRDCERGGTETEKDGGGKTTNNTKYTNKRKGAWEKLWKKGNAGERVVLRDREKGETEMGERRGDNHEQHETHGREEQRENRKNDGRGEALG